MNCKIINTVVLNDCTTGILTPVPRFFDTINISPVLAIQISTEDRLMTIAAQEPLIVANTHDGMVSS